MRAPILNLLLIASWAGASLAQAQTATPAPQTAAISSDTIKQREQELEAARASKKNAEEAQAKLKGEITSLGQDRTQFNQQLIDTAANVRAVETKIDEAEARLRTLNGREQETRASLDSRRADIVEVLAALQRAGRRTPPALLVRPEDALQSLRTAMLLGAVVPELRGPAEKHRRRARPARLRPRQGPQRPDPAHRTGRRAAAPAIGAGKGPRRREFARDHAVKAGRRSPGADHQDGA